MRTKKKRPESNKPKSKAGYFFPKVQTKLTVGGPGDKYEREADKIADQVVGKTSEVNPVQAREEEESIQQKSIAESVTPLVQKMEDEEEAVQPMAEEEEALQTKERNPATTKSNIEGKLRKGSGGSKMDTKTQTEMETGFGTDFSSVNIHDDSEAVEMNQSIGSQAFTHSNDIYFNEGKYNPDSKEGKHLLAHELTHTIQQKGNEIRAKSADLNSPRFRGDTILEDVLDGKRLLKSGETGDHIIRLQQGLVDAGFLLKVYGVDGIFKSETEKAVKKYQKANALSRDGVVGKNTMAALDLYYSVDRGAEAMPPAQGSNEAKMLAILKKGDKMTKKEAEEAQKLLFGLNGDDFKRALKAALENDNFFTWISNLGIMKIIASLSKTSMEVVIPTTLLQPAANVIDADFARANQIYNPHGVEIEKGNSKVLSEKETKKVIKSDLILHEFTGSSATSEELKLIKHNRVKNRITGYWVPAMSDNSRGEALTKGDLSNMPDDRTSVVTNSSNRAQDTFAHEVGHVLGLDHTETDNIADTTIGDKNNLMTSGTNRNITGAGIDKLTAGQLSVIRKSLFIEIGKKGVNK